MTHMAACCSLLAFLLMAVPSSAQSVSNLMPMPAKIMFGPGVLAIDASFDVVVSGARDARVEAAANRLVRRLSQETGIPMVRKGTTAVLAIECLKPGSTVQQAVEDESYTLTVTSQQAQLRAQTPYGALRGVETFLQLVEVGPAGFQVREVTIEDRPRFAWRGLLMDVCRHWIPVEVVKRNLDAMAAVKLNVLHWHLSEDQGFRVESRRFPKLHELGSDGNYYTQAEIRDIVAYARERGIRVVPEFDMPGHVTAWLVGYPELASAPGPYEIERRWGVSIPTMDPTREQTYAFLDRFIGEMVTLFPDPYWHIGGDEVDGRQWNESAAIKAFKARHGLKTNADLQAYFNRRLQAILRAHGKKMVGWDEIFHPDLPTDIVVQSWRGQDSLAEGAAKGYQGILSAGYYLDHIRPASYHYGIDPLGGKAAGLPDEAKARILGGEACMWAEFVNAETVDSRIWPRAAAVAERLWSPPDVKDVADMYRRLDVLAQRLEWLGVTHQAHRRLALQRLAGYRPIEALEVLADTLVPLGLGPRARAMKYTSQTPFNRLVDSLTTDNPAVRQFAARIDAFLADPAHTAHREAIAAALESWKAQRDELAPLIAQSFLMKEIEPVSRDLAEAATIGLFSLRALVEGVRFDPGLSLAALDRIAKSQAAEVALGVVPAIRKLVEASGSTSAK